MYINKKVKRLLIVAPTSVCSVWPSEFAQYADFKVIVKVLIGTKKQRLKTLRDLDAAPATCLRVAVINYESVWRDEVFDVLAAWDTKQCYRSVQSVQVFGSGSFRHKFLCIS